MFLLRLEKGLCPATSGQPSFFDSSSTAAKATRCLLETTHFFHPLVCLWFWSDGSTIRKLVCEMTDDCARRQCSGLSANCDSLYGRRASACIVEYFYSASFLF